MTRKLKMGMIGGGKNAFIGAIHRIAANMDGLVELHCGAFSSSPEISKESGKELFLSPSKSYNSYEEMITIESQLPIAERMDFVTIVTPNVVNNAPFVVSLLGILLSGVITYISFIIKKIINKEPGIFNIPYIDFIIFSIFFKIPILLINEIILSPNARTTIVKIVSNTNSIVKNNAFILLDSSELFRIGNSKHFRTIQKNKRIKEPTSQW